MQIHSFIHRNAFSLLQAGIQLKKLRNQFRILCLLGVGLASADVGSRVYAVGASPGFTTVEAESGLLGGGATVQNLQNSPPVPGLSSATLEASGGAYVRLNATGQNVTLTNNTGQSISALNVRFCIPDAPAGGGITNTIDLYVNGVFRQALTISSSQSWTYESGITANGMNEDPSTGYPHDFWDETHFFINGGSIPAGGVLTIQKDAANTAAFYYIDLVDMENPPAPLSQPANSLSITSYGAVANNPNVDNQTAIYNCFNACQSQGKIAWIPQGTFYVNNASSGWSPTGITIQGAGMWYSTIYANRAGGGGLSFVPTSCTMQDFCIDANANDKNNASTGINMKGNNWVINRIWIQHESPGIWADGTNGIVENCRVYTGWADGININNGNGGPGNDGGDYLTVSNCVCRGNGDDGIAVNCGGYGAKMMQSPKVINNTSVATRWANQIGIYGGQNIVVSNNYCSDSVTEGGIYIGTFNGNTEAGLSIVNATVVNNTVDRCGSWGWGTPGETIAAMTIGNGAPQGGPTTQNITCSGNTINSPRYIGIEVNNGTNMLIENNRVYSPGAVGSPGTGFFIGGWDNGAAIGSGTIRSNSISNVQPGQLDFINISPSYTLISMTFNSWQGMLLVPTIHAFSSYYNSSPYVRNVTNLVQNNFVPGEPGLNGLGYSTNTHDNYQDDCWHHASGDNSPYVTFDLGGTYNLVITRYWNLNQAGSTQNGAKSVRISVSADGATFTILQTNTLAQAGGTMTEPSQNFFTPASRVRYVKIEPLDGYGGGWNGLSAVRFEVSPLTPTINAFSSYYNSGGYVRNVTNLVQNGFVAGEAGLSGMGFSWDTHDNYQDDCWHHASGDNSPYVVFDLGGTCNLAITRVWNLNQAGATQNGAKNVRISVSANGTTFTVLGTMTLNQGGGTMTEPAQQFATPAVGIRYVKLEPLDGYGGGWNGLSAVRFQ